MKGGNGERRVGGPWGCGHPTHGGWLPAGLASVSSSLESILKQQGWEWT